MWKSSENSAPIILSRKDWPGHGFGELCKALGISENAETVVIRESCSIEYQVPEMEEKDEERV